CSSDLTYCPWHHPVLRHYCLHATAASHWRRAGCYGLRVLATDRRGCGTWDGRAPNCWRCHIVDRYFDGVELPVQLSEFPHTFLREVDFRYPGASRSGRTPSTTQYAAGVSYRGRTY